VLIYDEVNDSQINSCAKNKVVVKLWTLQNPLTE